MNTGDGNSDRTCGGVGAERTLTPTSCLRVSGTLCWGQDSYCHTRRYTLHRVSSTSRVIEYSKDNAMCHAQALQYWVLVNYWLRCLLDFMMGYEKVFKGKRIEMDEVISERSISIWELILFSFVVIIIFMISECFFHKKRLAYSANIFFSSNNYSYFYSQTQLTCFCVLLDIVFYVILFCQIELKG